jgi:uncharacterized membrane protein YfcA
VTLGRRLFLQTLILSLCLTAALAIGALLLGELDGDGARIIFTTVFLAIASALALPAGVLLDHGRAPGLAQAVLVTTAAALALSLLGLWTDPEDDWVWQLAATLALCAVLGAQMCVSTWPRSSSDGQGVTWLYWIAIVLSCAVVAVAVSAIWTHDDDQRSARLIGALTIAAVLTTLLQPIVRRLERPARRAAELVLRLDEPPSDAAVEAVVEALARHGVKADVVTRTRDTGAQAKGI